MNVNQTCEMFRNATVDELRSLNFFIVEQIKWKNRQTAAKVGNVIDVGQMVSWDSKKFGRESTGKVTAINRVTCTVIESSTGLGWKVPLAMLKVATTPSKMPAGAGTW